MLTLFGFFKIITGFIIGIDIVFIPFAYSFESINGEVIFTVVMFHCSLVSIVAVASVATIVTMASIATVATVATVAAIAVQLFQIHHSTFITRKS